MEKDKIKQWLDANVWDGEDRSGAENDYCTFSPDVLQELVEECFDDLQPKGVSVDNIELNINLIVPALQYEGPDYYKGYHQAREDMLSTLPPSEGE
tara:strand:- start:275 stop:562 length:288 start_codon:yes stop_codon:yes gene_type:complete